MHDFQEKCQTAFCVRLGLSSCSSNQWKISFCNIRNNHGLRKYYQPRPNNTYHDLHYLKYHKKPHPIIVYSLFHLTSTINYLRPIIWALTMAHLWLAIVFSHTDLPLIFCLVFKRLRYLVVGIECKSFLVGLQSISKSLQTIKNTAFSCIAFDCKITNHATISFGKMRKKRLLFKLGLILPFACNEAVYFKGFYY